MNLRPSSFTSIVTHFFLNRGCDLRSQLRSSRTAISHWVAPHAWWGCPSPNLFPIWEEEVSQRLAEPRRMRARIWRFCGNGANRPNGRNADRLSSTGRGRTFLAQGNLRERRHDVNGKKRSASEQGCSRENRYPTGSGEWHSARN